MSFSNEDRDVFLIKTDRMIDRGALMSRYSRASDPDIRSVYHREFEGNEKKSEEFYRRIFLEYGDESIAELVTAQVGVQNVSNIASKVIEEIRIGLSYLEKSTRYVAYDKKIDGHYLFMRPERIGIGGDSAREYEDLCNRLFDLYSAALPRIEDEISKLWPIESFDFSIDSGPANYRDLDENGKKLAQKSYRSSVRSRALDDARFILPASTLTNIGISGNARSFIHLIQKLKEYGLPETERISSDLYGELRQEFPQIIDDAVSKHGMDIIDYKKSLMNMFPFTDGGKFEKVKLIRYGNEKDEIQKALAFLMYPFAEDASSIISRVKAMDAAEISAILGKIRDMRKNRRMKIGRPFEAVNYVFEVTTNYGAFRDLQRHRFLTIMRKPLTASYGYDVPPIIAKIPDLSEEYSEAMREAAAVYARIREKYGYAMAQYAVPFAYRYPVVFSTNLAEAAYFIEIRSTPQAHFDLRDIAIRMYNEIRSVHPALAELIKFVDTGDYPLGRLSAEVKKNLKSGGI
ncbi:FAD-dependent thymidylate synthase [Thermoplasma sp.]|uniref:FAD-dependent thymidylate synthase n=1 Tax=Thermoplasma sp. TaxID=1973142 RepID=UPI002622EADB|nr:FAD-dependent thymidylate synthase [Thermoplasma sp.]